MVDGAELVRSDSCAFGATCRRSCGLWSTCTKITGAAALCAHPCVHPEGEGGSRGRTSYPLPRLLALRIVECFAAMLGERGLFVEETTRNSACRMLETSFLSRWVVAKSAPRGAVDPLAKHRVAQLRVGFAVSSRPEQLRDAMRAVDIAVAPDPAVVVAGRAPVGDFGDPPMEALGGLDYLGFERQRFSGSHIKDKEFGPIVIGLRVMEGLKGTGPTEYHLFRQARAALSCGESAARTAHRVVREMGDYEWREGLLLRRMWDDTLEVHALRVVVPEGGARSYWYNGRKCRLGSRKSILLLYHDSAFSGAHSSVEDTLSKISRQAWWPSFREDVRRCVHTCAVCQLTKPQRGLTFEQRSSLYDRPFQVVYIDAIGPIHPSDEGNSYILHAQDAFTGLPWLKAVPKDDAATTAKFLAEDVFLDFAGFPAVLRSDRGSSYVNEVVAELNARFGVEQAFGSSYRPQSQGYTKESHQRINNILRAYTRRGNWSRWVKIAQWTMRVSRRPDRGGYSPYELVTGMKPQGPLDSLWRKLPPEPQTPRTYVDELQQMMRAVQTQIQYAISADVEKKMKARAGDPPPTDLSVGDFVFLRVPPRLLSDRKDGGAEVAVPATASARLLPNADPRLFRVSSLARNSQVYLEHMAGEQNLGFAQLVHVSRLIQYELGALEAPVDPKTELKLELIDREGRPHPVVVTHPTALGLVWLQFRDEPGRDGLYDSTLEEYRWVS